MLLEYVAQFRIIEIEEGMGIPITSSVSGNTYCCLEI